MQWFLDSDRIKKMVRLSIIILNYNTKELTLQCLKSIQDQYKKQLESEEFEVIVVDNNSSDTSVSEISNISRGARSSFAGQFQISNFKLIKNDKNEGFSKGNNVGVKEAKGRYLLFLNSDTEVQDQGLISMVDYLDKNENVGVLGAKLLNPDGSIQRSAGKFYNLQNVFLMLFGGEKIASIRISPSKLKEVDWVSGAALMIRSDLFNKLGGFDENIFMYIEDMELCFRLKKDKCKVYFYPDIKILHKETGSSNRTFAIVNIYKNLLYFYQKHKSSIEYSLVKLLLYLKAYILVVIGTITRNNYLITTYRKAIQK